MEREKESKWIHTGALSLDDTFKKAEELAVSASASYDRFLFPVHGDADVFEEEDEVVRLPKNDVYQRHYRLQRNRKGSH